MSASLFDPVQAGREITHTYVEYVAANQVIEYRRQQRDAIKAKLIDQLRAAHGQVADFKAFLKEHVHIPRSTAYRMLAIADGRGEAVRRQERESKQRQRGSVQDTQVPDTTTMDPGASAAEAEPERAQLTAAMLAEEKRRLFDKAQTTERVANSFFDDDERGTLSVPADADTIGVAKAARDAWDRVYRCLCAEQHKTNVVSINKKVA